MVRGNYTGLRDDAKVVSSHETNSTFAVQKLRRSIGRRRAQELANARTSFRIIRIDRRCAQSAKGGQQISTLFKADGSWHCYCWFAADV